MPIEAWFDEAEEAAYVRFDQPLEEAGSFDEATFTIHRDNRWYETADVALEEPDLVRVAGGNTVDAEGVDVIDYDALLETLVGLNGLLVESFQGFPCPTQE